MTLKPGDHVEGKSKFISGKRGVLVREMGEGRKRRVTVVWDDDTRGEYFVTAIKKFAGAMRQPIHVNGNIEPTLAPPHHQLGQEDVEDSDNDDVDNESAEDFDEGVENEVDPEDGLEHSELDNENR